MRAPRDGLASPSWSCAVAGSWVARSSAGVVGGGVVGGAVAPTVEVGAPDVATVVLSDDPVVGDVVEWSWLP